MPKYKDIKIGLISDTHSYLDMSVLDYFKDCDQVWHIGDFGLGIGDELAKHFELKGVYGNIDAANVRHKFPEYQIIELHGLKFLLLHIAGSPGKYSRLAKDLIERHRPHFLVCGHSHICKVMRDDKYKLMYINPGAAGNHGFHQIRTIMRFEIKEGVIKNMQAIELGPRSAQP